VNRYLISPIAKSDLVEIRDYLAKHGNREVAARVLRELRDTMQRAADIPGIGHLRHDLADEPLRFYRVYNYLIIYRPEAIPLAIVRVLHGARDVQSILAT
jgi:plasmid stabilization system protein ParE